MVKTRKIISIKEGPTKSLFGSYSENMDFLVSRVLLENAAFIFGRVDLSGILTYIPLET